MRIFKPKALLETIVVMTETMEKIADALEAAVGSLTTHKISIEDLERRVKELEE